MFGLGMGELIVILVVALIVLGPKRLPDLATGLGKAIRERS
jgi:TatA/E family protein of Tat protein translocase